jgi:hypothetical protein
MAPAEQIILEKQKRTQALRAEYIKQITNPHRHATGEGGALVSFFAMLCHWILGLFFRDFLDVLHSESPRQTTTDSRKSKNPMKFYF